MSYELKKAKDDLLTATIRYQGIIDEVDLKLSEADKLMKRKTHLIRKIKELENG